jgi:hypothetical protein
LESGRVKANGKNKAGNRRGGGREGKGVGNFAGRLQTEQSPTSFIILIAILCQFRNNNKI